MTLNNCIFRNNVGNFGTVQVAGQNSLTCKNSIFDSNGPVLCNTKLLNQPKRFDGFGHEHNFCEQFLPNILRRVRRRLHVVDNRFLFIRNKNIDAAGGSIAISGNRKPNNYFYAHITRVLFQENIVITGSVLSVAEGEVVFTDCTFLNNFEHFQGGQIISGNDCGSVNLSIFHSAFRQTIPKIVISKSKTFVATSFLRFFSPDKLTIANTTFDQKTISDDPPVFVPAVKSVSIDNASLSSCPVGHKIKKSIMDTKMANMVFFLALLSPVKNVTTTFTLFKEEQQEVWK